MRLAEFIVSDMENILSQWEEFASSMLPAAATMSPLALRDHAEQILRAAALDMMSAQTRESQAEKSKGRAPIVVDAPETAAQTHGFLRAQSGFDIEQLAAEYRALRACVLRRWIDACEREVPSVDDVIRFNEAIDQAVAESISFFSAQLNRSRNLMLGMLGHDMRTPLMTIQNTASYLAALNSGGDVSKAASRLINSGSRIKALLDDLVDFNKTSLGVGLRIDRSHVDLAKLFSDELQLLRAAYPDRKLDLVAASPCEGNWDGVRLQRVLANLVVNAIKYGTAGQPAKVELKVEPKEVAFEVRNAGSGIGSADFARMCEPLQRGVAQSGTSSEDGSLGLGLFIAREIANAHDGDLECRTDKSETVVVVRLPRTEQVKNRSS
jgi:signal transduction histidine kinase